MGLSIVHIIVILVVVILLFGAKRLPDIGTGLGQAIANFRKAYRKGVAIDVTPPKNENKK